MIDDKTPIPEKERVFLCWDNVGDLNRYVIARFGPQSSLDHKGERNADYIHRS